MHEKTSRKGGAELMEALNRVSSEYNRWAEGGWLSDAEKLLEQIGRLVGAEFTDSANHGRNLLLCAAGRYDEAREGMTRMSAKRPKDEPLASAHKDATDAIVKLMLMKRHIKARRAHASAREAFFLGAYMQRLASELEQHGYVILRDRWLVHATPKDRAILSCFVDTNSRLVQEVERIAWPPSVRNTISPSRSPRSRLDKAVSRTNVALATSGCPQSLSVRNDYIELS